LAQRRSRPPAPARRSRRCSRPALRTSSPPPRTTWWRRRCGFSGGRGARIVFDPVAGPYVETLAAATAPLGTIFLYGILSLQPTPFPLFKALSNGLTLRGYTLFEITRDAERLVRGVAFVERGLAEGALKPKIAKVFPLDQIVEAHRYMESNEQIGKIVISVP
jgi:NADPH:quinone reductase